MPAERPFSLLKGKLWTTRQRRTCHADFRSYQPDPDLTYFQSILEGYGVSLNYDIVNENEQYMYYPNSPTALIPSIKSTDISSDLVNAGIPLLFPDSRSINILKNTKEYIEVTPVIVTSDKATGRLIDSSRALMYRP